MTMRELTKLLMIGLFGTSAIGTAMAATVMENDFVNPPDASRPGVYWFFMDGNLNGKEMTADLESMKDAGLGNLVFFEVDVGVPRGPVKFMSEPWQDLFARAVHDAERLGIDVSLGIGPGWCGSGGPWIKPEQSMQHLVFSVVEAKGPTKYEALLPMPVQRKTPWHTMGNPFYKDVAVFAFPKTSPFISDINEKALFCRDPFTSKPKVKPFLPTAASYKEPASTEVIQPDQIIDLSRMLKSDGTLSWDVPAGDWTIIRMGSRTTGASTRPSPAPGIGLECDRFDAKAVEYHLEQFVGKLLPKIGPRAKEHGLTTLHIDSWESGAQNWSQEFLGKFKKRRGYDARPWLPVYSGRVIQSLELSERFLWDIRLTSQELILKNHAEAVKRWGRKKGLELSIEPYDMTPMADLDLGAVADVPMAEFWSAGYGFDSSFSCIEASSIAHVMGRPIVSAEAFTAGGGEGWKQYPTSMKNQGDWALAMGINRFVYAIFQHQPLGDEYKPGMTMGPYGVHWDRGQTWWPMAKDYHRYVARCSYLLRQGVTVSDVLYLTPEGAPQVFQPPPSAMEGTHPIQDKKGYGFDGCSPNILMDRAEVKDGRIAFPAASSYRILVLPNVETMTPQLARKIRELVKDGATVVGTPPLKSPSLSGYPACDVKVKSLAQEIWGTFDAPKTVTKRSYGKGFIYWGGELSKPASGLYPSYDLTAGLLNDMGVKEDFATTGPIRYGHRRTEDRDIYFVSTRTDKSVKAECSFRSALGIPELWNPVTGESRTLPQYEQNNGVTRISMEFDAFQSFFVVFRKMADENIKNGKNTFQELTIAHAISGPWSVMFDSKWGGPKQPVVFNALSDWTDQSDPGIKYYSGKATYRTTFGGPRSVVATADGGRDGARPSIRTYLDLGVVNDMARVRLNGKDLGVVWCAPWRVDITEALKTNENHLEIDVVNRWPNRLIGDQQDGDANVRDVQWKEGFVGGSARKTGRYTFTTVSPYKKDSKLLPSGLLGPVTLQNAITE